MNVNNDELKWFIGNTLPVPDKLNIEFDDMEIECDILSDVWDENQTIYCYSCEYSNGNREEIRIPLEKVIERYLNWREWNRCYHLDNIIESCILERLQLLEY